MVKKLSLVLFSVLFAGLLLTGCGNAENKAEKYVEEYYKGVKSGEISAESSYDDYISKTSKDLLGISRETYVQGFNTRLTSYDKLEIANVTGYNDTVYKVKCNFEFTEGDTSVKRTHNEYLINEDGEFKFLQYGVTSKQSVDTSFSSKEFSMAVDTIYQGPDRIMVNMIAKNSTTSAYAVGYGGNGKIVVETDEGTYEAEIPGTNVIKPIDSSEGYQEVPDVKGTIKSIVVQNVYELNASYEPKDLNNSRSYTLYQAKEENE